MDKDQITITVSGTAASGKSRIIFLLDELLSSLDFDVEILPTVDYPNRDSFEKAMSKDFIDVIEALASSKKISLKEAQLNREVTRTEPTSQYEIRPRYWKAFIGPGLTVYDLFKITNTKEWDDPSYGNGIGGEFRTKTNEKLIETFDFAVDAMTLKRKLEKVWI